MYRLLNATLRKLHHLHQGKINKIIAPQQIRKMQPWVDPHTHATTFFLPYRLDDR